MSKGPGTKGIEDPRFANSDESRKANRDKAKSSQLIIFDDGTLYHIDLKKSDNIPRNVLLVGASDRVDLITTHFNTVTFRHTNKARPEFHTVAGTYKGVPIAAMSIGMGVGNMEIVMNELHALFEYNHKHNWWKTARPKVNIIRVGTCGTSLPDVPAGTLAVITHSLGLDNMGLYYPHKACRESQLVAEKIQNKFRKTKIGKVNPLLYCSPATPMVVLSLTDAIESLGEKDWVKGITTTSPGFFGPEGKQIGLMKTAFGPEEFLKVSQSFKVDGLRIVSHEMETSALFRLGYKHLQYNVGAICLVVDNLVTDEVIAGDEAKERMNVCIKIALESLIRLS